ncbi:MAG: TonB family protein [Terriglobales bacterium]
MAAVVSQVFSELDFTVETVHDPFGAVKKLMAQRYDALVVDSENEQNASLLFKSARNSSFNQGSLAIALAEGQMGVAKAYRIGANLVLTKPINVEQTKGTLRVARGLLRKSSDAAETGAVAAHPAVPAKTTFVPAERSYQPTNPSTPAMPARSTRPETFEFQAPLAPMIPQTMAAEFLEKLPATTASAKIEDKPAAVPPATATTTITIAATAPPERRKAAAPVPVNAVTVPSQTQTSAVPSVPGSAAAAAPAKEVIAPPAKQNKTAVAEPATPFRNPVVHDTPQDAPQEAALETAPASTLSSSTMDSANVGHTPSFAALDEDSGESGGKKKILIAAAVVLAVAALGYFGYGYVTHSRPGGSQPATTPQDSGQPKTLRPTSAPVETPLPTTPDSASIATPTLTSKTTTGAATGNPSPGTTKPPALRIAATSSENNAPGISAKSSANISPNSAANSAAGVEKPDSAPILVKPNSVAAKSQAHDEESAPPLSSPMVASANDSALSGLMSSTSSHLAKPALSTLRVSQGVSQGLLIKRVTPTYPPAALRLHTQGAVQIEVTISKEGNVTNPKVLSGDRVLSQAALEAVRQWRYKPYFLDGAPVEIQTQITVNFKAN